MAGPATVSAGTVAGGQGTSVVAAECHLTVDRRLLPDEGPAECWPRPGPGSTRSGWTGTGSRSR